MIPKLLLNEILSDPYYRVCVRYKENECKGRVTFEHAWIYAGKQIQEKWAIVPLCEYHHEVGKYQDGGRLNKDINRYHSLKRVTNEDMKKYPRIDWFALKYYLGTKYGSL